MKSNLNPRILGIQWNQWETDAANPTNNDADLIGAESYGANLTKIINGFRSSLGSDKIPFYLYVPRSNSMDGVASSTAGQTATETVRKTIENSPK